MSTTESETEPGPTAMRCRACGATGLLPGYQVDGFALLRCPQCDSLTTNHWMTTGAAQTFYDEGYYRAGDYAEYRRCAPLLRRNFLRFIERMLQVHRGRRLLEVGCAYGFFLEVAAAMWEVHGIDISSDAVGACAPTLAGRVRAGDLLEQPAIVDRFDWVVAWDTLEHLNEPSRYVRRFWEVLEPGGCVALTTGDVTSIVARMQGRAWRLLTPPSHLTCFSRTGIRTLLGDAGFEDVRIGTVGYTRSVDFMLYRLLAPEAYHALRTRHAWYDRVARYGLYLNLHDIMFVTAQKPRPPRS